jgi:energy-converting hydrogenase Eha subunit C
VHHVGFIYKIVNVHLRSGILCAAVGSTVVSVALVSAICATGVCTVGWLVVKMFA